MVFVTGGTGILGSYLLLELSKRHYSILALRQKNSDTNAVKKLFESQHVVELFSHIKWIEGSLFDIEFLEYALENVHTVYHSAAWVSFDERDRRKMLKINVQGTQNLINVALNKSIECFCHVSSIAVLDTENEQGITDENSEWNKERPHSSYAESKYLSEMEIWRASQESLNVIIVNPGIILGATHFNRSSGTLFDIHFSKNSFITNGNAGFVDAQDVAYCMVELVEQKQYNERFIVVSESISYQEVAYILRNLYGKKKPAHKISNFTLKVGVFIASFLKYILPKLHQLNAGSYAALTSKSVISNQKVQQKLGFTFRKVEDSLLHYGKLYLKDYKS